MEVLSPVALERTLEFARTNFIDYAESAIKYTKLTDLRV